MVARMLKLFAALLLMLKLLHNYFSDATKLFLDLYAVKFLDFDVLFILIFYI